MLSGASGGLYRFEHEFAGCAVGADGGRLAPAWFEAPACVIEQRFAHHGYGVEELRCGAELVLCRGGLRHGRGVHRARRGKRTYKMDLRGVELRQVAELSKS